MVNHLSKVMSTDSCPSLNKVNKVNNNLSKVVEGCITNQLPNFHKHQALKSPQYPMGRTVQMFPMVAAMVQSLFHHTLFLSIHLPQLHQITHQLPVGT